MQQNPESKINLYWKRLFYSEKDVNDQFLHNIDELIKLTNLNPKLSICVGDLNYAKSKFNQGIENKNSNYFLAPSVNTAIKINEILTESFPAESFWVSNTFAEICKILISRNSEKYKPIFERLLLQACTAISNQWLSNSNSQQEGIPKQIENEINKLSHRLHNILSEAMGTFFSSKNNKFFRSNSPDTSLQDKIVNKILIKHFERQLYYLLEHDRPRLTQYIRENMPIVYKNKVSDEDAVCRKQWEKRLSEAGYEDVLHTLRDMGDLISPDEVGQLGQDRRNEVMRAAANNEFDRVCDLLTESSKEIRSYIYLEAQRRLEYREPIWQNFPGGIKSQLERGKKLSKTGDPEKIKEALKLAQEVWQEDINNLDLRDWVAYLHAKTGNLPAAEQMLDQIRKRRMPKRNFITDWNLAVVAYERDDEAEAYKLLVPLMDDGSIDESLRIIVLAFSLKLEDLERFLSTIPKTLTLRFHPLAIVEAQKINEKQRVEDLLAQLLSQWRAKWELPSVNERFSNDGFKQVLNRAIVEGQTELLINWLKARIQSDKNWKPNYIELARVLEDELQDIEGAFNALKDCYNVARNSKDQISIDNSARSLLEFCKKNLAKNQKLAKQLGERAYQIVKTKANETLLRSFKMFEKEGKGNGEIDINKEEEKPIFSPNFSSLPRDPQLAERLAWVTARLTNIRTVSSYMEEIKAIEEFGKIVVEINPQESTVAIELIRVISEAIQSFSRAKVDDNDTRRILYNKVANNEKRLTQILAGGALTRHISDVLTPYSQAIQQVVVDIRRKVGVGPNVEAIIENPFISLEIERTTLVLHVTNKSERIITDVLIELLIENPIVLATGKRERVISKLDSYQSCLISIPIERNNSSTIENATEVVFGISIRASAEGVPIDLGIIKKTIPIKKFSEAIGMSQIPKLFQPGRPLNPVESDLFQGRDDILNKIKSSFFEGIQRERYFIDGIRRIGKTSILNFLPLNLPENVIPVLINLDKLGLNSTINSAGILFEFCRLICNSTSKLANVNLELPDEITFNEHPARTFDNFLSIFKKELPGKKPFLMIDEFQVLLTAIEKTGSGPTRDTLVLDLLRGYLDEGEINAIFTGSVRFDRLSGIIDHRIFGSLTRLRVSFLSENGVSSVLKAGIKNWGNVTSETVKRVYELTGGYSWLVQTYGSGLVEILNKECRNITTIDDVDLITNEMVLSNNELFKFWWPIEQLSNDEERFIELFLRKYSEDHVVSTRDFFSNIHSRDQATFRRAFDNLRACEVLESTQNEFLKFGGSVLRRWLEQQMHEGKLKIRVFNQEPNEKKGQAGIFIDHENLLKGVETIGINRGTPMPTQEKEKLDWFNKIITSLLEEAEKRVGFLSYKVTVAFWDRPQEARLLRAYKSHGFSTELPEEMKMENAVDLKVADEVRRARERAMREGTNLGRAIIVSADGDLSHAVRALVNDGVTVEVWGGSNNISKKYIEIVGAENYVALDDVCGL